MDSDYTVHADNKEDPERTLCGRIQTRYDSVSTLEDGSNIDCLACLVAMESAVNPPPAKKEKKKC